MRRLSRVNLFYCWRLVLLICIGFASQAQAEAYGPDANAAVLLRARFAELGPQLESNPYNRPLYLNSLETSNQARGEIYALVNFPLAVVNAALNDPAHWCDVLILHLNTKYCHAATGPGGIRTLRVSMGKKTYQALDDAHALEFVPGLASTTPDYFEIRFNADSGPLGTRDYRLLLEAVAVPGDKTFLHLSYAYGFSFQGRLTMLAYLATVGHGKVGFTSLVKQPGSPPAWVGGMRGTVERNTMRYFLAIDAYLGALAAPPARQQETRLQNWFAATEQYPRQLHEVDRDAYLDMKRRELARMQSPPESAD